MNKALTIVKSLALAAWVIIPNLASAEKLSKHKVDGWDEWYWSTSVTVQRGEEHTFWITGLTENTAVGGLSVYCDYKYKEDGETYEDSVWASKSEEVGSDQYVVLTTEDWESYYGSSGSLKFTVYVDGDGEDASTEDISFKFGHATGDVVPKTYGTEDNPQPITVGTSISSASADLIDGSYYFKTTLQAGRKYKFYTSGGTPDDSLSMDVYADGEEMDAPDMKPIDVGENDEGYVVEPLSSGTHVVRVDGSELQSFTLNYGGVPARLPAAHEFKDLGAISSAGAKATEFELGHRNDPESGYFDNVIDQSLAKVTLAAGSMYRFATEGCTVNAIMEVYDAKGNVLQTNRGGIESQDCEMTFKPSSKGDYYVGVCEELEDDEEDEPKGVMVTFSAKLVTLADGFGDAWDPEDDAYLGATGLDPVIGTKDSDVLEDGASAGSHTLGVGDLADWFRIDARAGLSYKFGAALGEPYASAGFVLQAKVYTFKAGKQTEVAVTSEDGDLTKGLSFTASASTSYYIEVTVRDGVGLDFGPYEFKSLAYDASGAKLGTLTVNIGGATASEGAVWWLGSEKAVTYPGGASLLLKEGGYTVNFATVKNWSAPAARQVTVSAEDSVRVDVKYSDTFDHKDDVITGATKLTPAVKEASVSRSLWTDDPADWFSFAIKPGSYYAFAMEPSSKLGDAYICVYASDKKSVVAEGTSVNFLCHATKGDYYVKVAHKGPSAVDSQYVMTYSTVQVGTVGFAKTASSVKDSATSVALTVNRANGKEGKVRVRYSTFAGTARPGVNYINQSGILEWEANDAKAKTITIGLLGELVPTWKEDCTFTVQLAALDPEDVAADEQVPMIGAATATVTITSATKKSTGTVQFSGYGELNDPFANLKKPAATVKSGEQACFWLERTDGTDGTVAVTVTPTKGKAMPDIDYVDEPQTLVWTNGEAGAKCFILQTLADETEVNPDKAMTLKLSADKTLSTDTAKLGAAATLTISDYKVSETVEDYAAGFAKEDGIAIKAAKANTWYFDAAGTLRSITPAAGNKAELTVTLTGPGKFALTPTFVNDGSAGNAATCTFGKEVINLSDGEEIVRYVEKGSTTAKFAVSRVKGDRADAEVYLALDSGKAGGEPFAWKRLLAPTLVSPVAGSVVDPAKDSEIEWTNVDEAGDGDVIYRVWFLPAAQKKDLGKGTPVQEDGETSYCTGCGMVTPGPGESWVCRVDSAFVNDDGEVMLQNANTAVWTYQTISSGAPCAKIIGGKDVDGNEIAKLEKVGNAYPVKLMQGVYAEIALGSDAAGQVSYALASGTKLPDGLKLDAKKGVIAGTPTKVGEYSAVVTLKTSGKAANGTEAFAFTVEGMGLAAGTFNGIVRSDDERLLWTESEAAEWSGLAANKIGSLTLTSAATGKLSAKLTVGGTTYSFADNAGWDGKTLLENGHMGVTNVFESAVKLSAGGKTQTCINRLVVAACAEAAEDWEALDTPMTVELTLNFLSPDKKSVVTQVVYAGMARRDNLALKSADFDTLAALADWSGYYTVSLPCYDEPDYMKGNGYLTMTIDAKGKAKVSGVLADGATKLSCSGSMAYVSESASGEREAMLPIYYGKGQVAFGGWLRLKLLEDGTPVVVSDSDGVLWINADTAASIDGESGLCTSIEPVGGYYNTVYNLQKYYLDYAFRIDEIDTMDLPEELLGNNEEYVCYPGLYGDYLKLAGSDITMDKQVKSMRTDDKKLIDWEKTVNPSALTMSFKRATGIYSGQFEMWAGNAEAGEETKQTKLGTFKHQGVLLLSRDESTGTLAFDDAVMPGFWNFSVSVKDEGSTKKRTFTGSLPFVIAPEAVENDWSEELPRTDDPVEE